MKLRFINRFLFSAMVAYLTGCAERPDINSEINSPAQSLSVPTGNRDDANGDTSTISVADARVVLRADAVLKHGTAGGSTTPPDASAEKLIATESYKGLVQAAEAKLKQERTAVTLNGGQLQKLSENEFRIVRNEAKTLLLHLSQDYEVAATEQALLRTMDAEAKLGAIHNSLKEFIPKGEQLPSDALALAPRHSLESALEGLKTHKRRIDEALAIGGVINDKAIGEYLNGQIERIEKVLNSNESLLFEKHNSDIFKNISKKRWDELAAERNLSIQRQKAKLLEFAETFTGWQEIRTVSEGIRGPPMGLGDLLYTSIRDFSLDPSVWARNEARLLVRARRNSIC